MIAVILAVITATGLTACSQNAAEKKALENTSNYITEAEAKEIALAHADKAVADVTFTRMKLDTEDGRNVYEVGFYYENREYDYDIDAFTGEIIGYDHDTEGRTANNAVGDIGEDAARDLILEKAEGASEGDIVIRQNTNDGEPIYEGTVAYGAKNYVFQVDAINGEITKWEEE